MLLGVGSFDAKDMLARVGCERMADDAPRRLGQGAVEAAIRAVVETRLKTQTDSMLRSFLAFKALHRDGGPESVDSSSIRAVVLELFTVLPTPDDVPEDKFRGTLALRGTQGRPSWLRNDSYRGSFLDYVGPTSPGRMMFEGENWRNPFREDAVDLVAETIGPGQYQWPSRYALAAIALRNDDLDSVMSWDDLVEVARKRFGLSGSELTAVTSDQNLETPPFTGEPWAPEKLSPDLLPPGVQDAREQERQVTDLPNELQAEVQRVLRALSKHGQRSIVALAGVPGTSKSFVARTAARVFASEGDMREIQFSPGYTYEEFIEGPRYAKGLEVEVVPGIFLQMNDLALANPERQYVLLIEEFTRADIPRVLGELLTYVEYRDEDDSFLTLYNRSDLKRIAPNIAILATYNPTDASAVSVDAALLRRMRVLDFPPNMDLLREMLTANGLDAEVIAAIVAMFEACRDVTGPERFEHTMPFGHAVFASVQEEAELFPLWHEELKQMLIRPRAPAHELYDTIASHYPWRVREGASVVGTT